MITNAAMTLVADPRGGEPAQIKRSLRFDGAVLHQRTGREIRIPLPQSLPFTVEQEP